MFVKVNKFLDKKKKTTMRYHLTTVGMAMIKQNETDNHYWQGHREITILAHCWW